MVKVLHNNNCSTSRAALVLLDENDVKFEIIDIIENPLTEEELRAVLKKLNLPPSGILRRNDVLFKEHYSDKDLTEEEIFRILIENPSLIERPILIKGGVAMLGRPPENIKFFIGN